MGMLIRDAHGMNANLVLQCTANLHHHDQQRLTRSAILCAPPRANSPSAPAPRETRRVLVVLYTSAFLCSAIMRRDRNSTWEHLA